MYAIHGGVATTNLTDRNVSSAMTRLMGATQDVNYGQADPEDVITALRQGDEENTITVNGTMGPPDFNGRGARTTLPSVYCVDLDPEGTENAMLFHADELRYRPETESLEGDDPCSIVGFMEE